MQDIQLVGVRGAGEAWFWSGQPQQKLLITAAAWLKQIPEGAGVADSRTCP